MKTIDEIKNQIATEKIILKHEFERKFRSGEICLEAYSILKAGIEGSIAAMEWIIAEEEPAEPPKGGDGVKPPTLDELAAMIRDHTNNSLGNKGLFSWDQLSESSQERWRKVITDIASRTVYKPEE